jgi:hypothetical protein
MGFPKVVKIRQHFEEHKIENIEEVVHHEITKEKIAETVKPGMKIAITAGSRGIANIARIIRATANELKKLGAEPFIVPSMGSHGGATPKGQVEVLNSLGITEEYCEIPIHSSMEVVQIDVSEDGIPVYMDKYAYESDGVIVMGRIKAHTDFKADIESGIIKMASIGLGKHKQAQAIHTYGVRGIRDLMKNVGKKVIQSEKVIFGVGIIEDAYENTAIIEAVPKDLIVEREQHLLLESKKMMPSLPVEHIDILYVDEIGKNFSGTGMDTNIIGRIRIHGVIEPEFPKVKYLIAGDLSEPSHGNALGIGLADLTTERLFKKINFQAMNENVITSTFLARASVPIVMKNDQEALKAAMRANWGVEEENTRFIRIPNTLEINELIVSEALLPELEKNARIEIIGDVYEMDFDEEGNLKRVKTKSHH